MYYYIYKTINLKNRKYYIGKHKGYLNDEYLGSGKLLRQAIKKYGKENFKKEILLYCLTEQELNYWEKRIVDRHKGNANCYNLAPGGEGGNVTKHLSSEEKKEIGKRRSISYRTYLKNNPEEVSKWRKRQKETLHKNIETLKANIKATLNARTEEQKKTQHNKITLAKLQHGYYSIYQLVDPNGTVVAQTVGAEKLAEQYGVTPNGIRLVAKRNKPFTRGPLKGFTVRKHQTIKK